MRHGRTFGQSVSAYDHSRPTYPAEAIEWLLPGGPWLVADVGAGTGKLSAGLLEAGHEVIAVDPDAKMLAGLAERYPHITRRLGHGEEIPLPDEAVNAVTYGQAWHWVDPGPASAEAARVLRPGGTLALVWNIRDVSTPWVSAFNDLVGPSAAEHMIDDEAVRILDPFTTVTHAVIEWTYRLDADTLVALAASRSHVIALEAVEREHLLTGVRSLAEAAAQDGVLRLPYRTHMYRSVLPG